MQRDQLHNLLNRLPEDQVDAALSAALRNSRYRVEMRAIGIMPIVVVLSLSLALVALIKLYNPPELVRIVFGIAVVCSFFPALKLAFSLNEWRYRRSVERALADQGLLHGL